MLLPLLSQCAIRWRADFFLWGVVVIYWGMKRLCACLVLVWLLAACTSVGVMRFVERGVFERWELDSLLLANALPQLEEWRCTGHVSIDKTLYIQYTYIQKGVGSNRAQDGVVYTIEDRDSVLLFVKREIVK